MAHLALYRKYRSQTFDDLVGQEHIVRTLKNAIAQGKIGHAYLFTGPRGTGKTSTARLLAKALNCTDGPSPNPPEDDPICQEIAAGSCLDVIEIDAASESGVDDVRRSIVEASEYRPSYCRYRIFIIDEVHDLSRSAFDALLKTIEEPPSHVVFILATTEFHKVPPTIRSRCQKFEFHRGSVADLTKRLEQVVEREGFSAEAAALNAIARMADGGYRDALTLLEQAILTAEGTITLAQVYEQLGLISDEKVDELLRSLVAGDVGQIHSVLGEFFRIGREPRSVMESCLYRLSDLTRALYGIDTGRTHDSAVEAALTATANELGADHVLALRGAIATAHKALGDVSLPRHWIEAEMTRLAQSLQNRAVAPIAARPQAARSVVAETPVRGSVASDPHPVSVPVIKATVMPKSPEPKVAALEPVDEPVPTAEESHVVSAATVAAPVVESGSELDRARALWVGVVEEWSTKSKNAEVWLRGSTVAKAEADRWEILLTSPVLVQRLKASKKGEAALVESVERAVGRPVTVEFTAHSSVEAESALEVQTATVESKLRGDALADTARDVLTRNDP